MADVVGAFEHVANGLVLDPAFREVEIVSTAAHRRRGSYDLTLVIDRPGGVDMRTCEQMARRINDALEAFPEPYTLAVESAGLDRPLVKPGDYERFSGQNIKVVSTLAIGGAKTHRGKLAGVRGPAVVLEMPKGELLIPLAVIKNANIEYDFRADLTRAKKERRSTP